MIFSHTVWFIDAHLSTVKVNSPSFCSAYSVLFDFLVVLFRASISLSAANDISNSYIEQKEDDGDDIIVALLRLFFQWTF